MSNILEVQNVVKQYGDYTALNNVSLQVPKGSIYGLLGPNGAGKTTLIRIINQITMPDSGVVLLDGEKLKPEHVQYIGYMPEERGLYKTMKVGEQCLYLAQLKGMPYEEAKKQLKYWFEKFEIEGWWNKKIQELSKGMAQKIQFIVTILHQPKLLILDEPFSGFDPVNANLIKDEIIELNKKGTSIIFSTHRMESVEEMCDYVALINNSKKVLDGKVFDVREKFKKNIFGVTLSDLDEAIFENFRNQFQIEDYSTENQLLSFDIKNEKDQNSLLNELMKIGKIRSFDEKIPSMNEVFINAVQS